MNLLLFLIAYVLYLPLTIINYFIVFDKGYFRDSAVTIDKLGNREFRTLFNKTLIKENGYRFGNILETISSVLGKNERDKTLSRTGKVLVFILNTIDKDHCAKSITDIN